MTLRGRATLQIEHALDGVTAYIRTTCPECKAQSVLTATLRQLHAWEDGTLIQNAFPNWPAEDRERLITGICGACWKRIFG